MTGKLSGSEPRVEEEQSAEKPAADQPAPDYVPTPETLRRAQVFWRQAEADLKAAAKQQKAQAHVESGYLSFQGAINALTVVCYLQGQFQVPNYSAAKMAALCQDTDERFARLAAACAALEQVQVHSPFGSPAPPDVMAQVSRAGLEGGRTVLETVRRYLKEHRRRYFAP
jgi:hypothetical protein